MSSNRLNLLPTVYLTWLISLENQIEATASPEVPMSVDEAVVDPCADEEGGGIVQFFSRLTNIMNEGTEDEISKTIISSGLDYEKDEKYDDAARCYNKAIKRKPSMPSYYKIRGEMFMKTKNWNEAIWDLRKAIDLSYPMDRECHKLLSQACFFVEEYGEAVDQMILTNDVTEIVKLGRKMFSKGKFEEAIRCYSAAIKRKPFETKYYRLRGNCFMIVDKARKAIEDFNTAVLINQNVGKEINRASLAKALFDVGNYDEAVEITLDSLNEHEITSLGNKLYDKGKYKKALRCYNEIIDKNLGRAEHFRNRARCHRAMENLGDAVLDFEKAIQLDPSDAEIRIDMGETLLEGKRYDEVVNAVKDLDVEHLGSRDAARLTKIREKIRAIENLENTDVQVNNPLVEDNSHNKSEERKETKTK